MRKKFLLRFCYVGVLITIQPLFVEGDTLLVFKEECDPVSKLSDEAYHDVAEKISGYKRYRLAVGPSITFGCENSKSLFNSMCNQLRSIDISMKLFHTTCQMGNRLWSHFSTNDVLSQAIKVLSNCGPKVKKKTVSIRTKVKEIVTIIRQMSLRWLWKKIILLGDTNILQLYHEFSYYYLPVSVFEIIDAADVEQLFLRENLSNETVNNFVVLCNEQMTLEILNAAKKYNFLEEPQIWAIFSDIREIELFKDFVIPFNSYIALVHPFMQEETSLKEGTSMIFLQEENVETKQEIISLCEKLNSDDINEENSLKMPEDDIDDSTLKLQLLQVYSVNDGPVLSQDFGTWDSVNGLTIQNVFPNMLRDLNGHSFKVATLESAPYIIIGEDDKGNKNLTGFFGDIFDNLAKEINFSYTLHFPEDQLFGKKEGNIWTGLIGLIVRGEADIAIGDISMTPERKAVVDFSPAIDYSFSKIFYKKPEEKFLYMIYILPFEWKIWFLITLSIFFSGIGLYIASVFSPNSCRNSFGDKDEKKRLQDIHNYSLSNCFLSMYNGFVQQGSEIDPPEVSGKIIFITVYLSFVIVFSSYTSIFTSYLTIKETRLPIETLQELIKAKEFKIGVKKATSIEKLFENATMKIFKQAYERMSQDKSNFVMTTQEGLDKAYTSNFAFITPNEGTKYFLRNNCSFVTAEENIISESLHIIFKKNFIFQEVFKEYLERLTEGGIIRRLKRSYQEDEITFCDVGDGAISLGFKRVVSLFLLLTGASFVAGCFLFIERLYSRNHSSGINGFSVNIMAKFQPNYSWKIPESKLNDRFFIAAQKYNDVTPKIRTISFPKLYHY